MMSSAPEEPLPPPPPSILPQEIVDSETQTDIDGSENSLLRLRDDELRCLITEERFRSATLERKINTLEDEKGALTKQIDNAKIIVEKILLKIDGKVDEAERVKEEFKRLNTANHELVVTKNQLFHIINNLNDVIKRQHEEICMWHDDYNSFCQQHRNYHEEDNASAYSSEEEEEQEQESNEYEVNDILEDVSVPQFMQEDYDFSTIVN
jgi:chromosome segregation ATPase